jgi:hypothetical protein
MVRVFICHSWNECDEYEEFVRTLDEAFSSTGWTNLSIPRIAALDVAQEERRINSDEVTRLQEALWRARMRLSDPGLRDVVSRTIYKRDGTVTEAETLRTVKKQISQLEQALAATGYVSKSEIFEDLVRVQKFASDFIYKYPVLFAAIRERITESQIVFVLLTSMVRLHEWIQYEIRLTESLGRPTIGVKVESAFDSRDFHLRCEHIIENNVAEVLTAAKSLLEF